MQRCIGMGAEVGRERDRAQVDRGARSDPALPVASPGLVARIDQAVRADRRRDVDRSLMSAQAAADSGLDHGQAMAGAGPVAGVAAFLELAAGRGPPLVDAAAYSLAEPARQGGAARWQWSVPRMRQVLPLTSTASPAGAPKPPGVELVDREIDAETGAAERRSSGNATWVKNASEIRSDQRGGRSGAR